MFGRGKGMYRRLSEDVCASGVGIGDPDPRPVTQADIAGLPATVQRYLHAMGVVNQPPDWSFQAHFTGRFRLRGEGSWMATEVWQYNSAIEVARFLHMRIGFTKELPMMGRDTYLGGKGLMHGKLLGLVTVAHSEGPETNLSELSTYLNDAVLMAPSMLLRPNTSFAAVDDSSFDVTLVDAGMTVTARVALDSDGRPLSFTTSDRYADLKTGLVRAEWETPVEGWQPDGDRFVMTRVHAIWNMPEGPLDYLDFSLAAGDVRRNVAPADISARAPR
jgi:hypothetical protein